MASNLCSSGDGDGNSNTDDSNKIPSPWIMLPCPLSPSERDNRLFFSLSSRHHRLHLPELSREVFLGVNCGSWVLVTSSGYRYPHHLFNLLTRVQIPLPPLPPPATFFSEKEKDDGGEELKFFGPEFYMPRISLACLSSDPADSTDFEVVVAYGLESWLAFYRSGDDKWSLVLLGNSGEIVRGIKAATYCNGQFYVADKISLFVCDAGYDSSSVVTSTPVSILPRPPKGGMMVYLVCIDEELVLVVRSWTNNMFNSFYVYKLREEKKEEGDQSGMEEGKEKEEKKNEEEEDDGLWFRFAEMDEFPVEDKEEEEKKRRKKEEEERWSRVYTVGESAIFLSQENSFAISTRGLGLDDCVPDSIYYFDVFPRGHQLDISVLRLEEFSIAENKRRMRMDCHQWSSLCIWSPIWIQPCHFLKSDRYNDAQARESIGRKKSRHRK